MHLKARNVHRYTYHKFPIPDKKGHKGLIAHLFLQTCSIAKLSSLLPLKVRKWYLLFLDMHIIFNMTPA